MGLLFFIIYGMVGMFTFTYQEQMEFWNGDSVVSATCALFWPAFWLLYIAHLLAKFITYMLGAD